MKTIKDLKLQLEPSNKIICYMCHLSSNCGGCCKKCQDECNGGEQICMIGHVGQYDRWQAWKNIIADPDIGTWEFTESQDDYANKNN